MHKLRWTNWKDSPYLKESRLKVAQARRDCADNDTKPSEMNGHRIVRLDLPEISGCKRYLTCAICRARAHNIAGLTSKPCPKKPAKVTSHSRNWWREHRHLSLQPLLLAWGLTAETADTYFQFVGDGSASSNDFSTPIWAVGDPKGHDWKFVEIDWSKWPTSSKSNRGRLITCSKCRLVRRGAGVVKPCRGPDAPPHPLQVAFWKGLVRSLAIKKTLCQAWGCSVSEANSFFGSDKVATTGKKRKSKHLPGVKTQAGNKKPGQASNPGPSLFFSNFERSKFFFGTSDGAWARKTRVFPLVLGLLCPLVRGLFGFRSLDRTIFRLNLGIRNFLLLKLIRDGVEPNLGALRLQQPHSNFRVCSLNVQGVPGAYRALNLLPQQGYQILGLQETKFSANEWRSFALAAGRAGFKGYHLAGPGREDGLPGGGVVLLSNNLAHKFADSLSVGRSQVLMVWSQRLGVMTYYGPPGAEEDLEEAMLQCHVRCQLHNHEWISFGDSNQALRAPPLKPFSGTVARFLLVTASPPDGQVTTALIGSLRLPGLASAGVVEI